MQMEMIQKAGVAILITNKIDFKTKCTVRDEGGHYIMIKATIQQEDITLVSIYTPNIGSSKYVMIDNTTVIVGDFNNKAVGKDKEGPYIMTKGTIQQEDITLVNIYAPNIGTPNFVKQILTDRKGKDQQK